jgi:hypothetical protein
MAPSEGKEVVPEAGYPLANLLTKNDINKNHMSLITRFIKAAVLATWLYSLLFWAYVSARIIFTTTVTVYPSDPIINAWPHFTFLNMGIFMFMLSFLSLIVYLTVWGRSKDKVCEQRSVSQWKK